MKTIIFSMVVLAIVLTRIFRKRDYDTVTPDANSIKRYEEYMRRETEAQSSVVAGVEECRKKEFWRQVKAKSQKPKLVRRIG
jgi:hypothetical protein